MISHGRQHALQLRIPDAVSLLKNLATEFDNDTVKIDTTVFNASRITKVVGTFARKGLESEGRPYRMARVI